MLIVFFFLIYMNKVEEGEGSYSHNATLANTSLKKKNLPLKMEANWGGSREK